MQNIYYILVQTIKLDISYDAALKLKKKLRIFL